MPRHVFRRQGGGIRDALDVDQPTRTTEPTRINCLNVSVDYGIDYFLQQIMLCISLRDVVGIVEDGLANEV